MRVALLGSGLIGGSIGLAIRSLPQVSEVVAFDRSSEVASRAVDLGAADSAAPSPAQAVTGADLVFIATPVLSIPEVIKEARDGLKTGAIVTDVGSTKARVVVEAEALLGDNVTFLGGHPMAGTEHEGIEGARAGLFDGAWWILTPTPRVGTEAFRTLHSLLSAIGCHVLALEPAQHDALMAMISHLPHLTAATLMNQAADRGREEASLLSLAAGGFRDLTRVAASNPGIWLDICRENRQAIVAELSEFIQRLSDLRFHVESGDMEALERDLAAARDARRGLVAGKGVGELFEVFVPIPDKPGVLSDVTTLVGNLGINIEDLQITHAEEGGRGLLRLLILGEQKGRRVFDALSTKGYNPRTTSI